MKLKMKYRPATLEDVDRLVEIEQSSFNYDQLDHKKFRYFIAKGHDDLIVQYKGEKISGYGLLLYRKGTSLSRLYSVAISKEFQGQSLGKELMIALEKYALKSGSSYIRLEVKKSNKSAIKLYEKIDYISFAIKHQYYENNEDAICMEKKIQKITKEHTNLEVPFYQQTTEFTCGSASLMMAMKSLSGAYKTSVGEEIQLWREATTIFMTSGHGGCGPHGLALAAFKRGFKVELFLNTRDLLFINSVRQQHKKDIIKIVQEQFDKEIKKLKIPATYGKVNWNCLKKIINDGGVPLVLISSYRLTETKTPHWIVITGMNDEFVFFNDPYVEKGDDIVNNINIPVRKDEFETMAKFGSNKIQSIVALYLKKDL